MEIRAATLDDRATLVDFQQRMAAETEGISLDSDAVRAGVEAVLRDPSRGSYLVADEDGALVACLLTLPEWSDWRNGTVLWIHSVFVLPEARGRGVFRALYEHLRARVAADPGLKGLRLYVDQRNERACQVYERLGMDGDHYRLYEWMPEG